MDHPYPSSVYNYFTELAAIPHGSGNTAGIRRWCLETAKRLHIEAYADETGNVIMKKPASAGCEDHPGVILQGHMDMVCAKLPDCRKNMETEGLDLVWDGDFLRADGTTLGGDDGIAVAYAFAVLEDDAIVHPPLTVILTVDEETGMDGATGLSPDTLTGKYLINIDSEAEGVFTVGCAGGVRSHLRFPCEMQTVTGTKLTLTVNGLTGGHSGAEIHKPLVNANLAVLELLRSLPAGYCLCELAGGVRDNVIPTECTASLTAPDPDAAEQAVRAAFEKLRQANPQETGMALQLSSESGTFEVMTADSTAKLVQVLSQLPNGVQKMNEILHMPETSLNLGIFSLTDGVMQADALIRSGINAEKYALADRLRAIAEQAGGTASQSGDYAAWEYKPDTELERKAAAVFTAQYGKAPVIETIHAGLECGILTAKAPHLEAISIGPDLLDIHTPRERLSIASAARTWDLLLGILRVL